MKLNPYTVVGAVMFTIGGLLMWYGQQQDDEATTDQIIKSGNDNTKSIHEKIDSSSIINKKANEADVALGIDNHLVLSDLVDITKYDEKVKPYCQAFDDQTNNKRWLKFGTSLVVLDLNTYRAVVGFDRGLSMADIQSQTLSKPLPPNTVVLKEMAFRFFFDNKGSTAAKDVTCRLEFQLNPNIRTDTSSTQSTYKKNIIPRQGAWEIYFRIYLPIQADIPNSIDFTFDLDYTTEYGDKKNLKEEITWFSQSNEFFDTKK